MKRFLLAAISIVLLLSACEGPAGPPGWDGKDMEWDIRFFTVKEKDWVLDWDKDGLNPYYICEKSYPELDEFVYESGLVSGFMLHNYGTSYEVQTPLPYVIHRENIAGDRWTETYTFDFMPESVAFYVHVSDFYVDYPPALCDFRIVLNW